MNGAGLDHFDFEVAVLVGNLDGGEFLAFLLEHLDTCIEAVEVDGIVGFFLQVEIDGGGSGSFGVGGHFELFRGRVLELGGHERRRGEDEEDGKSAKKALDSHGVVLCFKHSERGAKLHEGQFPFPVGETVRTSCC